MSLQQELFAAEEQRRKAEAASRKWRAEVRAATRHRQTDRNMTYSEDGKRRPPAGSGVPRCARLTGTGRQTET
jgi:hypothetical protein